MDKRNFLISSFLFGALMVSAAQCSSRRADRSGAQTEDSAEAVAHFEELKGIIVKLAKHRAEGNAKTSEVGDLREKAFGALQSLGVDARKVSEDQSRSGGVVGSFIGILKDDGNFRSFTVDANKPNIFNAFFALDANSQEFDSQKMNPEFTLEALRRFVNVK